MLNIKDLSVAFSSKSDFDLKRANLLFRILSNPVINKVGATLTQKALDYKLPIEPLILSTIYQQFVGGTSPEKCIKSINELSKYNIETVLDYSVEAKKTNEGFDQTVQEISSLIDFSKDHPGLTFTVVKMTGIASFELLEKISSNVSLSSEEQKEWDKSVQRLDTLCNKALENKLKFFIDAEESWIQVAIDQQAKEMMKKYNKEKANVFTTFQMYRNDRIDYLKNCILDAQENNYYFGVKLVRGAYLEQENERAKELCYPSPMNTSKQNTDKCYDQAVEICLQSLKQVSFCLASHNEESTLKLVNYMKKHDLKTNHPHISFAQLYGMSDHISYNLAKSDYTTLKYIPYGPVNDVIPYLMRRAEENVSMTGQMSRELQYLQDELLRRKTNRT
ncbi:MAG: proline dehydrogenase family protein [Candidatus Cloacimonetes bacterium]|nr:proline dehydrogenase family protein [Candidatus Cloacimonadota bacterium]